MTKAELIARLGENKDTPFYKSNYNVAEVIELLNTMEDNEEKDFISVADNHDVAMIRAFNYIEEHISEELPPFSILGEDTRGWIADQIKEYIDEEYFDEESRNDLIKHTKFGEDCLDTDNAEFEIDYGNQISVDRDSIHIDDYEVKRQLEDLVTEFVDSSLDGIDNFCSNIDNVERTRKVKAEIEEKAEAEAKAERLRKEQELQDLQREAEAEMKSEAEEEKSNEQEDETENEEN